MSHHPDSLTNGIHGIAMPPLSFLDLAPEIHERIFELLAELPGGCLRHPLAGDERPYDPSAQLYPCALVARAVYAPVMRVLYRSIDIRDHFRMKYLRRSVTLNPPLGLKVRHILVRLGSFPADQSLLKVPCFEQIDTLGTARPYDDAWAPSSLHRLLDHCPLLQSLNVRGCDDVFGGKTSIRTAKCFGPHLDELGVTPVGAPFTIVSLANYFDGLRLTKVSFGNFRSVRRSYSFDIHPPAFESLVLTKASIDLNDLKVLIQRSSLSLRCLVLDLWPAAGLGGTVNAAADPDFYVILQSLPHDGLHTLEYYWRGHNCRLLEIVSNYPRLRRLGFGGPLSTTSILRHLPPTLEELVFERCPSITADKIVDLLSETDEDRKGVARKLRQVEVGPNVKWTEEGWEQIRWQARRKGIQVGYARTHAGQRRDGESPPTP